MDKKTKESIIDIGNLGIGLFVAIVLLFTVIVPAANAYTINGTGVLIDDSKVRIQAYPHTIRESGYVNLEVTSKVFTGNINVIFGFNSADALPKSLDLYDPQLISTPMSYTCNGNNTFYNYTLTPKIFNCYYNNTNGTVNLIYSHSFETANATTKTAYWTENTTQNWTSLADLFTQYSYNFDNKNVWYVAANVPVTAGQLYTTRMYLNIKGNSNGKYDVAFYPSSYGSNLAQAISDGNFYYLDPWFNTTSVYKRTITANFSLVSSFPVPFNIPTFNFWNPTANQIVWTKCPATGNCTNYIYYNNNTDYKVVNSTESGTVPQDIELGNGTSTTPTVWNNATENYAMSVWHLSNLNDNSGNSNTLTAAPSGVFANATGYIGGAYWWNGTNAANLSTAVPSTSTSGLNSWRSVAGAGTGQLTVMAVVMPQHATKQMQIYDAATGGCGGNIMTFGMQSGTTLFGQVDTSDCNAIAGTGTFNYAVNNWYFVVMTYQNLGNGSDTVNFYGGNLTTGSDFRLIATNTKNHVDGYNIVKPYYIGGRADSPAVSWVGNIDEVRTYNRTMGLTELNMTYQMLKGNAVVLGNSINNRTYNISYPFNYTGGGNLFNVPVIFNGTNGFICGNSTAKTTLFTTYPVVNGTSNVYCNNNTDSFVANSSDARFPFEIEAGEGTSYNPFQVWNRGNDAYNNSAIGIWHLSSLNDSSGNGFTLTAFNSPLAVSGIIGNAYNFTIGSAGSEPYLRGSTTSVMHSFKSTNQATLITVFKTRNANFTSPQYVFAADDNSCTTGDMSMLIDSNKRINFYVGNLPCGGYDIGQPTYSGLQDNTWYVFIGTMNTTGGNVIMSAWIGPINTSTPNLTFLASKSTAVGGGYRGNQSFFYIGDGSGQVEGGSNGAEFNGTIDEIRMYNRTFQPDEINATYQSLLIFAPSQQGNAAVTLISPQNGTYFNTTNITIQYTITNTTPISSCRYTLNGANTTIPCFQNTTTTGTEGLNSISVTATDGLGINYTSATNNFTIDTTFPTVSIQSPTNSTYNTTTISLNYLAADANINTCTRELNGVNATLPSCGNTTITAIQGSNRVKVFVNDTLNHTSSATVNFFVDSIIPQITIVSPTNNQVFNFTPIPFTYTFIEANVDTCKYELDGAANVTLSNCQNTTLGASNGTHVLKLFINDTANNRNSSSVNFTIDTHAPVVDIQAPTDGGSYTSTNITLNYTAFDPLGITGCKYELNGAANVTLPSSCPNTTFTAIQGANTIKVWANDTANNYGFHMHTFYVDSIAPVVAIQSPTNTTYTSNHTLPLRFTASDTNTLTCGYRFDNGSSVSLPSCGNTTFSIPTLGSHNINVTATDSFGNPTSVVVFFTVINNAPVVSIQSPVNQTYYNGLSFDLNYTASDNGDLDRCFYRVNDETLIANTTLANCGNTSFTVPTSGFYHLDLVVNDTWGNTTTTTVNFTLFQGINISTLLPNGNALTLWNITATNGTDTFSFIGLNNSALLLWNQLPNGTTLLTASKNGFDTENWTVNINSTMGLQSHNFTLYPTTNISLYDTRTLSYLSDWFVYTTPSYLNQSVNTTLTLSNRIFPSTTITFFGTKTGYKTNSTSVIFSNSTGYNIIINTTKASIIMTAPDELATGQLHGFNTQFVAQSNNVTVLQVTGYRRSSTNGNCYDNNIGTACLSVSTTTSPVEGNVSIYYGQDYNNATYNLSWVLDSTGAGVCQNANVNVYANGQIIYTGPTVNANNEIKYSSVILNVDNWQGNWTRTINFTVQLQANRCGSIAGGAAIEEFRMINNTAGYTYVNDNTISLPTDTFTGFTTVSAFYRGEETYETNYTQRRMLIATLSQAADYNLVQYLLKDTQGFTQLFTVLDPNNIPLSDALITLAKWYSPTQDTTIAQCISNIAGSCSLWMQPNQAAYSLLTQKTGYISNYTRSVLFTGNPNPAYVYMKTGQSVNFTSIFTGITVSANPVDSYQNGPVNITCQVLSSEGSINYINLTAYQTLNSTITGLYNSTYTNSQPSGATMMVGLNSNGRFDVYCNYEWVSNATGSTVTYHNVNSWTVWIYSDALRNGATGTPLGGVGGIILAIGIILLVAGPIAFYSPTYGVAVGIFMLLMFAWLGMVPWYVGGLAILTGIAVMMLRSAV